MFYKFEVDGGISIDSSNQDGEHAAIRSIKVMTDTKDPHVTERSSSVILRVEVVIAINNETKSQLKNLMKWSLQTKGSEIYRTVKITLTDDEENQIRYFEIPQMFCEDYFEFFTSTNNENNVATLKLIQKSGKFESVSNEA